MLPAGLIKIAKRTLSVILALVLVFSTVSELSRIVIKKVMASGAFTSAKLVISDSRADATAVNYAFTMTPTEQRAIKTMDIYFCTNATGACTAPADLDTGTPTIGSTDNINGTGRTAAKIGGLDNTIRVTVTTPASQSAQPITIDFTGVTNTSDDNSSFYARVTTYDANSAQIDTATVASAVLTDTSIQVSATVESTFSFTVTPVAASSLVNGETTTMEPAENSIAFGVLTAATPKVAAHDLEIVTNADNGYTITVEADADPPLVDGTNNIDKFGGGVFGTNASPTTWSEPAGTIENTNTGYFGYTTNDPTLTDTGDGDDRFTNTGNEWAGMTTSPLEVAYNAAAPGGSGEITRVGWQIEVNTYQPPGSYTGSVVLIATPTY
ncbi:hypothetical protein A2Z33_00190 [Candidatus Gottesmanbacteria bacterium RBG_16_52_11]|uniref:Uncharacterized protein n=1 Tax=Candidatus Gottesmanbacteria bacterium RBG_16_52_11 TaxID=1798374 RepID=A0A1F5YNL5_9BACT|nr:MAG: hypothetical protein A2Z33_00190 [Candidatus Gottesmanbacteria bacterium RBG_16_52_11]